MAGKLTVYFTSDTHGYLYPANFADTQPHPMGLLSMSFPKDENTLIIDGGDTIQGSPLLYFCRERGLPLPVSAAMNVRGYDYFTLGNHDFNNGPALMKEHIDGMHARCICANVQAEEGLGLNICPRTVHTLGNGLRVGIFGVVTDWVKLWEKPENLTGIRVSDPLEAARLQVELLRQEGADVIIGIYHGGVEKDLDTGRVLSDSGENIACRLCEELPIDLLLTGHQHIAMANREWHGTHIVQTPFNAMKYVKVEMGEDGAFSSELCSVPDHAALTPEQESLWQDVNRWLDTPIGHLDRDIWPGEKLQMAVEGSAIADFFNRVQLWASGADVSCTSLGNEIRGFARDVTVRDVMASYVYSNTLVVLQASGEVIRRALEQCARYFDRDEDGNLMVAEPFLRPKEAHFNYDYFSGMEYVFDLDRPAGERVVSMTRNGRKILPQDSLKLVMCNYRATGAGDFEFYTECPVVREIQTEVSELILNYLGAHPQVSVSESHPVRCIGHF